MSARIRWYNRLAAWWLEWNHGRFLDLAMPVWNPEVDDDEEWEDPAQAAADDAYREGQEDGYWRGREEAEGLPW